MRDAAEFVIQYEERELEREVDREEAESDLPRFRSAS
jgi:hypothetical protein